MVGGATKRLYIKRLVACVHIRAVVVAHHAIEMRHHNGQNMASLIWLAHLQVGRCAVLKERATRIYYGVEFVVDIVDATCSGGSVGATRYNAVLSLSVEHACSGGSAYYGVEFVDRPDGPAGARTAHSIGKCHEVLLR